MISALKPWGMWKVCERIGFWHMHAEHPSTLEISITLHEQRLEMVC
jgi:hypothetical protein